MGFRSWDMLRVVVKSLSFKVLYHLDIYLSGQVQNSPSPSVDTPTLELVEEFILQRRMSALQELQLLEIMCSCFQEQSRDAVRQLIFSALFTLQGDL
uniref:Uncharacterized protein n=1 Tax=Hucho hucho TaxID=62062 RepID=A0A4W5NBT7_9TELE